MNVCRRVNLRRVNAPICKKKFHSTAVLLNYTSILAPLFFIFHNRLFNQRFATHHNTSEKRRNGVAKGQVKKAKQC